ncbi:uncharacterized protein LOC106161588 [Lingula anatina]|uniref:Uncharacterized protein LOC106161588 n=1 Tax=Lingula anatina TaxID=7574 RepID=A0A1S3I712_LINAN|nr:uncharacterized protein LOC106161588 [Lingula anatina]|eukprot:XP_013394042.1 uncharacterized protein LOC106161588 [Lingula anatina]
MFDPMSNILNGHLSGNNITRPTQLPDAAQKDPEFTVDRITLSFFKIPFEDQLQAFQPPPPDVAHVIIATNVAESSLTLPRVRVVLDFGIRKQIVYNPKQKMRMLELLPCSKASMEQRKGRAGRVFPGVCIRMFTKKHFDMQAKFDMPQMRISPLEKIVLEVKYIGKKIAPELRPTELLLQTIEPPDIDNIYAAIEMLANLGAIEDNDEDASITTLGLLDMQLPVDLHLTCVIMYGVLFDCPCDGIIMAAALQAKDPFTMPTKKIQKEDAQFIRSLHSSSSARNKFDMGYYSEPLMLRQMFLEWLKTARRGQEGRNTHKNVRADFCRKYRVESKRLGLLENLVQNLASCVLSFLPEESKNALDVHMLLDILSSQMDKSHNQDTSRRALGGKGRQGVAGHFSSEIEWLSIFSNDMVLLQTILTAGLSPMVAFGKVHEGEQDKEGIRRRALTEAMKKAGVDPTTSVALVNPPTIMLKKPDFATQILKKIADPDAVRFIGSEKIILDYNNAIKASKRGVIRDIPLKAHLLDQFGEGNETFLVEVPEELNASNTEQQESECEDTENDSKNTDHSNETFNSRTELRSPKQPYRITWTILSIAGAPLKTPGEMFVAVPCWRNPIGFSCDTTMQEHYGVFYHFVSGSRVSAWVNGFTALPCEYDNLWAMVLLLTFHKSSYGATWKVDVESGRIVSATIFEHELKFTKKHPLTHPILLKINEVRQKISGFLSNLSPFLMELMDLVETSSIAVSPDDNNTTADGDDSREMEKIGELEDMPVTEVAFTSKESAGGGSDKLENMDAVNTKTSSSKRTIKETERKRKDATTVTVNAFTVPQETGIFTYLVPYDTRVFDETYIKTLRETMKAIQPCSALASDALKKLAALEEEDEREEDIRREYLHKASEDELLDCIIAILELHKPPTNTVSFKELSRTPSVKRLADQLRGQSFGDFSWQRFFDRMIKQGLLHVTLDKEGEDVVVQLPTSDIMLQGQPSSRNLAQQDVLYVRTVKNGEDEAVDLPVSDIMLQGQALSVEIAEQDMLDITHVKNAGDAIVDTPASDMKQGQLSSEELSQQDLLGFTFVKNAEDAVVDLSVSRTKFQGKPQLEGMAKQDVLNVTLFQNGENAAIVERPSSCTMLEEYGQLGTLTEVSSTLNNQYHADLAESIESVLQTSRFPVTLSCLKKHPDVESHLFLVIEHEPSYTLTKCIEEHGHLFRMVKIWNTEAVCLNKAEDTDCANVTPIVTLSHFEGAKEPTIQSSTLTGDPSGPSQFHGAKRAHIQVEYKKQEKGEADAAGALVMEEDREDKRIGIKASGAPAVETHRKCDVKVSAMLHMEQKIKDEKKLKAHASKISCMTPHGPDLNDEKDEAAGLPTVEAQMKDENTKREVTFVSSVPSQGLGFGGGKSALPVSPRHFGLGVKETCIVPGSEMQTGMTNETHTDHSAFDQEKYILTQQIVEHLSQVKEPVLLSALGTVPSVRCIVLSIRAKHKKGFKLKDHLLENNQFLLSHVKGADFVQIKDVKRMQGVSAVPPLEKKMKDEEKIKAHVTIKQFMTPGSGLNFENDEAYVAGALVMEEDREDGRTGIEASAAPAVETQGKCDVRFSEMPYMEKNNNSKEKLKAHATVMSCMTSHGSDLNDEKDEAAGPPTVEAQMKDDENTMREVTIVPSQGLGFDGGKSKGNSVEAPKEEIQRIDDIKPKKKVTMVPYVKPQDQMVNGNNKVDAAHATKIPWMIPHGSDLNDEKDIAAGPPTVKVQMKDDENTKREVTVVSSVPSQGLGFDGGQSEGKAAETTAVEKQRIDDIKPEKKVTVIPCVQLSESPGQSADAPQPSALPVSPGGPSQFVFDVKEACTVTGSEIQTGFKNETHRDHSAFDQEKFTLTQQIVEHLLQVEEPVSLSTLGTVPSVRCILLSIKAKYEKNFKLKNHLLENNQFLLSRVKDIDFVQMKNIKYILTREIVEHLSKVKEPVLLSALGTVPSVRCILLSLRAKHKKNFKLKDHLLENNQFLVSQVKGVDFVQMKDVIGRKQGVSAVPDMENKMKDEEKLKAHATPHGPDLNDEKDEAAAPPTGMAQMKDDENAMSEVTIVSNVPSQGLGFDGGKSKGNSDETPTVEKQSIGDVKQKKKVTMVPYVKPQDQVVNGNNKVDAANLVTVKTLPMNHEPPVGARLKETGQLLDEDYQYFAQLVKQHLSRWEQDSNRAMTLSQLEENADIREQLKLMREKCSAGLELRTIFRRLGKTFALDDNGALRFTRACIQKEAYEREKQLLTQLVKSHVTATILPISLEVLAQQVDIERQLKKMEIYKNMKYTRDENIDLVDILGGCGDTFEVIESKKKFLVRLSSAEVKTNAESFAEDKIRLGLLVKNHLLETGTGGPMKLVELCQKADVKEKLLFMKAKYNRNDLNLLHIISIFGEVFVLQNVDQMEAVRLTKSALRREKEVLDTKLLKIANRK